jgi:hypothetical protein
MAGKKSYLVSATIRQNKKDSEEVVEIKQHHFILETRASDCFRKAKKKLKTIFKSKKFYISDVSVKRIRVL